MVAVGFTPVRPQVTAKQTQRLEGMVAEDGKNSFMTGPDEQGRFGKFGGRFVS